MMNWLLGMGKCMWFLLATIPTTVLMGFASAEVYIVFMEDLPVVLSQTFRKNGSIMDGPASESSRIYKESLIEKHDLLLEGALRTGTYEKLYSYHHVINGFSVNINTEQASIIGAMDGVRLVQKDQRVKKLTTYTPEFLGLPSGAWDYVGGVENAGENVVIGLVDTGINPSHPSFASTVVNHYTKGLPFHGKCDIGKNFPQGSCNSKIISAQYFAAAANASGDFDPLHDFASPYDQNGHGSHTASTAAGNHEIPVIVDGFNYGLASGMAPRARIAMYKALFKSGGYLADVIAAIDQAVEDGVDVLSLSIAFVTIPSGVSTFLSALDIALLHATQAGVFVVQAAGNDGPARSSVQSFSPWITSIACGTTDRIYRDSVTLGNGKKYFGVGLSPRTPGKMAKYKLVSSLDVYFQNTSYIGVDECQEPAAFDRNLVYGKILMCTYNSGFGSGTSNVHNVAETAKHLGAIGFVLLLDTTLGLTAIQPEYSPSSIPGILILDIESSQEILDYYNITTKRKKDGSVAKFGATATLEDGRIATYTGASSVVASFSSRGPNINNDAMQLADVLKPNIMAPGNLIWAAWNPSGDEIADFKGQNFAIASGTSMSAPHIAGIAALIKQKHSHWSPSAISSALATTANSFDKLGHPIMAEPPVMKPSVNIGPASPFDCGSGFVNTKSALDPGLIFDAGFEDYFSFLCSVLSSNTSSVYRAIGLNCNKKGFKWPSDLNLPSITLANLVKFRNVPRKLKNVAAEETYKVKIKEPEGIQVTVSPSSFVIKKDQSISLLIQFRVVNPVGEFRFGEIEWVGNKGHNVRIPLSVLAALH